MSVVAVTTRAVGRGLGAALRAIAGAALVLAIAGNTMARDTTGRSEAGRFLTGQMLVAVETMPDPRFAETVIYLIKHNTHGAFGLVVNRILGESEAATILEGLGEKTDGASGTIRVHSGGPVDPNHAFVLHSTDYRGEGTEAIDDRVAMTRDVQVLRDILESKGPKRSLFAFGYAGWGPGQLERELIRRDWYVAPADMDILFDRDVDTKWERALARRGIDL